MDNIRANGNVRLAHVSRMLYFETLSIYLGEGKVRFASHAPFFVNETAGWISSLLQDPECHKTEPNIVFDTDFSLQIWAGTFFFAPIHC